MGPQVDNAPRGVRKGEWVPPSPLGFRSGEGCAPPQNFFFNFHIKIVSFHAFWVAICYHVADCFTRIGNTPGVEIYCQSFQHFGNQAYMCTVLDNTYRNSPEHVRACVCETQTESRDVNSILWCCCRWLRQCVVSSFSSPVINNVGNRSSVVKPDDRLTDYRFTTLTQSPCTGLDTVDAVLSHTHYTSPVV